MNSEELNQLVERLKAYTIKAIREAKVHTSWINENRAYEDAFTNFIEKSLNGPDSESFLSTFLPFQKRIALLGMVNSLSQLVLKIASPGVPDFYQGTELWNLSLVDPDNRRPVDYEQRSKLLDEIAPLLNGELPTAERLAAVAGMLNRWTDARIKLFVTTVGLHLRRDMPDLLLKGEYIPLSGEGMANRHIVSFAREYDNRLIIVIVPRLIGRITDETHPLPVGAGVWKTARIFLPPGLEKYSYKNLFTGELVRPMLHGGKSGIFVAEALRTSPVAILVKEKS